MLPTWKLSIEHETDTVRQIDVIEYKKNVRFLR